MQTGKLVLAGLIHNSGTMTGPGGIEIANVAGQTIFTWSGGSLHASNLNIAQGGSMKLAAGANKTLVLSTLAITGNGKLDLNDDAMVLNYTGASPAAAGVRSAE